LGKPAKRLGFGKADAKSIKSHPFFKDFDWEKIKKKELDAPWKPVLESKYDLS